MFNNTKRSYLGLILSFATIMIISGCNSNNSDTTVPNKSELAFWGKADGLDSLCFKYNLPPNCDICEYFGFYSDGVCDQWMVSDKICKRPDPDCWYNNKSRDLGVGGTEDSYTSYGMNDFGEYPIYEAGITSIDGGKVPFVSETNSGKICTGDGPKCPDGEVCIINGSATKGMCMGTCWASDDFEKNLCPVNNPETEFSLCNTKIPNFEYMVCTYYCKLPGKDGTVINLACPDNDNFSCVDKGSNMGVCVPK